MLGGRSSGYLDYGGCLAALTVHVWHCSHPTMLNLSTLYSVSPICDGSVAICSRVLMDLIVPTYSNLYHFCH
eukprot:6454329-Amphidinium_carterae.1